MASQTEPVTLLSTSADPPRLVVRTPTAGVQCMHARVPFSPGHVLADFAASWNQPMPSRYTIQRRDHDHLNLCPDELRFINHSCTPNVHFDVERLVLVAVAPIAAGDELGAFYPATEWAMSEPFDCWCGSKVCLGRIDGARSLPAELLRAYRLSAFVESQLAART